MPANPDGNPFVRQPAKLGLYARNCTTRLSQLIAQQQQADPAALLSATEELELLRGLLTVDVENWSPYLDTDGGLAGSGGERQLTLAEQSALVDSLSKNAERVIRSVALVQEIETRARQASLSPVQLEAALLQVTGAIFKLADKFGCKELATEFEQWVNNSLLLPGGESSAVAHQPLIDSIDRQFIVNPE